MATRTAGYECEFVGNPPRVLQFQCFICLLALRDPYQATCCGKSFCKECIHRVKAANGACPTCREKDFPLFHDKGLQRILYNFRVYCTHKSEGCEWTGELRELDNHLNLDPPADKDLEGCPYTLIPFVQPQQPGRHVTGAYKPIGAEFTMTKFDEYKSDNDTWYSPHFYTHPNGYKMYLHVDANGNASGRGTHLSVFVCLMRGEFDDQLEWPFQGNITVKLVNQEEDRDHMIRILCSRNAGGRCERVMTRERINNGWGIDQFLSHAELQPKYLKNDCIKLHIKNIDVY